MERLCERTLWQMGLIVIALCVGCSWERASNVSEDQIQWGSETRDYLSYEEYFSQQRLYDYAEDVFSGWSLQDADISYDGTVLRLTDSKGIPRGMSRSDRACKDHSERMSLRWFPRSLFRSSPKEWHYNSKLFHSHRQKNCFRSPQENLHSDRRMPRSARVYRYRWEKTSFH